MAKHVRRKVVKRTQGKGNRWMDLLECGHTFSYPYKGLGEPWAKRRVCDACTALVPRGVVGHPVAIPLSHTELVGLVERVGAGRAAKILLTCRATVYNRLKKGVDKG